MITDTEATIFWVYVGIAVFNGLRCGYKALRDKKKIKNKYLEDCLNKEKEPKIDELECFVLKEAYGMGSIFWGAFQGFCISLLSIPIVLAAIVVCIAVGIGMVWDKLRITFIANLETKIENHFKNMVTQKKARANRNLIIECEKRRLPDTAISQSRLQCNDERGLILVEENGET